MRRLVGCTRLARQLGVTLGVMLPIVVMLDVATAEAAVVALDFTLAASDPLTSGPACTPPSPEAVYHYRRVGADVDVTGTYVFTDQLSEPGFDDGYIGIYNGPYDPANPTVGCMVVIDDDGNALLTAGTPYVFVLSTFNGGGTGTFRYLVDGPGTFHINPAPVAVDDAVTVDEDGVVTLTSPGVLANDYDPDGDALTAALAGGPSHGTLTFGSDGALAYEPDPGFSGADSFTYNAVNPDGVTDLATVAITVNPVNDPPAANDDSYATTEDAPLSVAAPGVLANDIDAEGDALSTTIVASPSHGSVTLAADGSFVYTPATNYNGPDSFTYTAQDGVAGDTATVALTISPVNDAPTAAADTYATTSDQRLVVAAGGVLGNDSDVDGDSLTAVLVSGPSHGDLTLSANGGFTYTPNPGFGGTDSFVYRASDGTLAGGDVVVTLNVTFRAPTSPPTATKALTVSPASVVPGSSTMITGSGFVPGETVRIWIYSDPVSIGQAVADGSGNIAVSVAIPASTSVGAHTIVAFGADDIGSSALTVRSPTPEPTLPATGSRPAFTLTASFGVMLAGATMLRIARRRHPMRA